MKNILIVCVAYFLVCCNNPIAFVPAVVEDNVKEIDIDNALENKTLMIEDLIDTMFVVTLQTDGESLLSSIDQIIVGDQYIYVLDTYQMGGVSIFHKDGRFLKRITHGNGPGEISRAMSICFDRFRNQLLVQDIKGLLIYDKKGEFIKDISLDFIFAEFAALNNGYIFFQLDFQNRETNLPSFVITDESFNIRKSVFLNYKRYVMGKDFLTQSQNEDEIVFNRPLDNSIYQINSNGDISTKFKFSFDKCEAELDKYNDCRDQSFDRETEMNQGDKCYYLGGFAESENYILLRIRKIRRGDIYVYINKKTYEIRSGINNPFEPSNMLYNKGFTVGVHNNFFVKYLPLEYFGGINAMPKIIEANKPYLSESDLAKLAQYKEDDNPLLFFYKLK